MSNFILILVLIAHLISSESLLIRRIHFEGNQAFSTRMLKRHFFVKEGHPYSENDLDNDIVKIRKLYNDHGFQNCDIVTTIKTTNNGVEIFIVINEGSRAKVDTIIFEGIKALSAAKALKLINIKKGDYLVISEIERSQENLLRWYKDNGYAFASINYDIKNRNGSFLVLFSVRESVCVYLRQIIIRGTREVSDNAILKIIGLKIHEKFSLNRLLQARQMLYSTKLFERVQFYLQGTEFPDSIDVRFDVIELPSRLIGVGVGFQTSPTGLMLSTHWQHYNFLRKCHKFSVGINVIPYLTKNIISEGYFDYRISSVFGVPISFCTNPKWTFERIDGVRNNLLNTEFTVIKSFGSDLQLGTVLKYFRAWSNCPIDINRYKSITNSQVVYLQFDSRNRILSPERGVFLNVNFEYAGGIFRGDNDFYKIQNEISFFYPLSVVITACRIVSGIVIPYGKTRGISYYNLFWLGGNKGLRGYPDKYRSGNTMLNLNFELRSNFRKLLDFVIFCDFGKLTDQDNIFNFNYSFLNYSAGFGVRINSPFGPLRCDYAKRMHSAPQNDWGRVHFGLLNFF
ncbi:MAG: BamA/TamA family outer membrane protein [candidate division WOR-3 bacterium]